MSLQLILGSSGVGKSYYSFTKIIEESRKNPEKNYLVIVPEQFTMQTQKELVSLHPDNMAAGPASYGMTDTMGRMHSDAQFAGSSSVPAHVEMMGLIGMGNNPMVGATVACAVAVEEAMK